MYINIESSHVHLFFLILLKKVALQFYLYYIFSKNLFILNNFYVKRTPIVWILLSWLYIFTIYFFFEWFIRLWNLTAVWFKTYGSDINHKAINQCRQIHNILKLSCILQSVNLSTYFVYVSIPSFIYKNSKSFPKIWLDFI